MAKRNYAYGGKAAAILEWLNTEPSATDSHIAKHIGCSVSYVHKLRKEMVHADTLDLTSEMAVKPGEYLVVEGMVSPQAVSKLRTTLSPRDVQEGGDHYKKMGVQPWDVFDTWPVEQRIGAYRANCTKYVMRLDEKDTPLMNAKKLRHYATKLVEVLEEANGGR